MNKTAIQLRLARLQHECEVSAAPALVLLAACSALVLALGLKALVDETHSTQPGQLTQQELPVVALQQGPVPTELP